MIYRFVLLFITLCSLAGSFSLFSMEDTRYLIFQNFFNGLSTEIKKIDEKLTQSNLPLQQFTTLTTRKQDLVRQQHNLLNQSRDYINELVTHYPELIGQNPLIIELNRCVIKNMNTQMDLTNEREALVREFENLSNLSHVLSNQQDVYNKLIKKADHLYVQIEFLNLQNQSILDRIKSLLQEK